MAAYENHAQRSALMRSSRSSRRPLPLRGPRSSST
eukprot:COSAG01_NODE_54635_length_330_cov_13.186147_1_plen_34_part_01